MGGGGVASDPNVIEINLESDKGKLKDLVSKFDDAKI